MNKTNVMFAMKDYLNVKQNKKNNLLDFKEFKMLPTVQNSDLIIEELKIKNNGRPASRTELLTEMKIEFNYSANVSEDSYGIFKALKNGNEVVHETKF